MKKDLFENYTIDDLIHESNNIDIKDNKKVAIVEDDLDSKKIELIKNKGVKNKIEFVEINNDCPVIDFLDEIENEKLKSKTISNIYILADLRNKARPPLSTYIDDGIYELRTKFSTNITRVFYFFIWGDRIIMTNGYIKKSQKIDKKEFAKAKKLMNVYLKSKANLKESNDIVSTISLDDYLEQCLRNEEFRYYWELELGENKDDLEEDKRKAQKTILNQKTPSGKFVATYAILTSDNPSEKVMTDEELHKYYENPMKYNNEKRAELKRLLRDGVINSIEKDGSNVEYHIPYVKIRGKYGETKIVNNQGKEVILPPEHSFLLLNVQVGEAEGIAKRFKQQSFIYGINHDDGTREVYTYTMKYSSKTKEITGYTKQGELIEPNADPSNQNAEDYYSISKGYKWSFDFIDDAWDDTDVDLSEIRDVKNIDSMKESLKENSAFRRFNKRKSAYRLRPSDLDENNRIIEGTKKLKNGKWANVGKDGKVDSGTFKTKKQADAQRRAIWANWKK